MFKTVVTTLGLALAACSVGEVNGPAVETDAAQADPRAATFDTVVKPIAMAKGCLDVGCHSGTQTPQLMSFDVMTTNPTLAAKYLKKPSAENILITKDTLAQPIGQHQARPYFDAADKAMISAWIDTP